MVALRVHGLTCSLENSFNDGNKRTALVSMLSFLDLNGYRLKAGNIKIADKIVEIYPWRLGFRFKCASYLLHGKAK
ncbi:hypothetical protein MNBD_GAMMA17-260 [hydrothermal vent metagenome]|uniref:Fido domain-containing protein n=1 Tax=hydrothermal vent metagenome TaxID=652676 RepID=A0A3B0Z735_9ZZZZ